MSRKYAQAGLYLLTGLIVAVAVLPFIWQIITSIKVPRELTTLPPILPRQPTGESYYTVFVGKQFYRYIINSAIVAGLTTTLTLIVAGLASYSLARLPIKGKGIMMVVVLALSMLPQMAVVSALYIAFRRTGLLNTYSGLVIAYCTFSVPLGIWIMTSFFREIPHDLEAAAKVDGCSPLQAFVRVIVPLAAPGVFTTAILVFIQAWNEFLFALTFTTGISRQTVPVGIALMPQLYYVPWGAISAASVIVTLPLIIVVLVFQRRIVEGLTAGGVKG